MKDISPLGWKEKCPEECYGKIDHTHNCTFGKNLTKICKHCKKEMALIAQIFRSEIGTNECELFNDYLCNECQIEEKEVIYYGINNPNDICNYLHI